MFWYQLDDDCSTRRICIVCLWEWQSKRFVRGGCAGLYARSWCKHSLNVSWSAWDPYMHRIMVLRAGLECAKRDSDEYRGALSARNESSRELGTRGVILEEYFEQELLWDQASDTDDVTEAAPAFAWQVVQSMSRVVPVTKKCYVEYIWDLANSLQTIYQKLILRKKCWRSGRPSFVSWCWRFRCSFGSAGALVIYKKSWHQSRGVLFGQEGVEVKKPVLEKNSLNSGQLDLGLGTARAAIGREERVIHDSAERICSGHLSSILAEAWSYRDRAKILLATHRREGRITTGFLVRFEERWHLLHLVDENCVEERRGGTALPEEGHSGDVVVVVSPSTGRL